MTKLEELKEKQAALRAEMLTESKRFFDEAAKEIFAKHPTVESFSWRQYTPYFNDGDECVFSVHSYPEINGEDVSDESGPYNDAKKLIESIDEPTMKEMFGDHVKITVLKTEGVTIDEYSHD